MILESAVDVAQRFLQALEDGRIIDALDTFAADAVIREGDGHERRGMRAIALSLLPYRTPGRVEVVEVRRSTHGATAYLRAHPGPGAGIREYRATFRVAGNRIRSMYLKPT